jgi:hypothetical protein
MNDSPVVLKAEDRAEPTPSGIELMATIREMRGAVENIADLIHTAGPDGAHEPVMRERALALAGERAAEFGPLVESAIWQGVAVCRRLRQADRVIAAAEDVGVVP